MSILVAAYAVVGPADYLVTGDKDLLDLREIEEVNVITMFALFRVANF